MANSKKSFLKKVVKSAIPGGPSMVQKYKPGITNPLGSYASQTAKDPKIQPTRMVDPNPIHAIPNQNIQPDSALGSGAVSGGSFRPKPDMNKNSGGGKLEEILRSSK